MTQWINRYYYYYYYIITLLNTITSIGDIETDDRHSLLALKSELK